MVARLERAWGCVAAWYVLVDLAVAVVVEAVAGRSAVVAVRGGFGGHAAVA
jgi:hypothetical protein